MQSTAGLHPIGPTMTTWAESRHARHEISANTLRAARSHIRAITAHFGEHHPIEHITEADIEDWLAVLNVGARSRNTMCGTYRQFFRWATRRRWIDIDPFAEIRNARTPQNLPRLIPPAHVTAVLDQADFRGRVLITIAAHLGLRRAELAAMRIEDYDPAAGTLLVHGKRNRERVVAVEGEPALALDAWLRDGRTTGPMWPGRSDRGLSSGRIAAVITDASHAAGMHYTPHQYRHLTATTMVLEGAPTEVVRRHLGHESLATLSGYTSASVEDIRPHVARSSYGSWAGQGERAAG